MIERLSAENLIKIIKEAITQLQQYPKKSLFHKSQNVAEKAIADLRSLSKSLDESDVKLELVQGRATNLLYKIYKESLKKEIEYTEQKPFRKNNGTVSKYTEQKQFEKNNETVSAYVVYLYGYTVKGDKSICSLVTTPLLKLLSITDDLIDSKKVLQVDTNLNKLDSSILSPLYTPLPTEKMASAIIKQILIKQKIIDFFADKEISKFMIQDNNTEMHDLSSSDSSKYGSSLESQAKNNTL